MKKSEKTADAKPAVAEMPPVPTLHELYHAAKTATTIQNVMALLERMVELEEPSLKVEVLPVGEFDEPEVGETKGAPFDAEVNAARHNSAAADIAADKAAEERAAAALKD